jgi:hypothetical protein
MVDPEHPISIDPEHAAEVDALDTERASAEQS